MLNLTVLILSSALIDEGNWLSHNSPTKELTATEVGGGGGGCGEEDGGGGGKKKSRRKQQGEKLLRSEGL